MNAPSYPLQPNLEDAQAFIDALEPSGIVTFTPWPEKGHKTTPQPEIHGTLKDNAKTLTRFNNQKLGIGLMVNAGDGKGAKANNVQSVRALFAEYDEAQRDNIPQQWPLTPHIVCESSPNNRHVYWLVDDCPLEAFTRFQKAIAATLGSDPSITDLRRIMRLPGFWHQKAANPAPFQSRLLEVNDLAPYSLVEIIDGLNLQPELDKLDNAEPQPRAKAPAALMRGELVPLGERHQFLVSKARALLGHGVTGEALEQALENIHDNRCEGGIDDPDEIPNIVKWAGENIQFDKFTPSPQPRQRIVLSDWTAEQYKGEPTPREWLIEGVFPTGVPVLLAAQGGVGKSYLSLDLALAIATEKTNDLKAALVPPRRMGGYLRRAGIAVVITSEDDKKSVHQRLHHLDPMGLYDPQRLIIVALPDAGGAVHIVNETKDGLMLTPEYLDIKAQLLALDDLALVVFDPLQSFMLADINADPKAPQFLASELTALAAKTGATIMVTHHMRKPTGNNFINDAESARAAVRGSSVLVDGFRVTYALWPYPPNDAKTLCKGMGKPYQRDCLVAGGVVKDNVGATKSIFSYYRDDGGCLSDVSNSIVETVKEDLEAAKTVLFEKLCNLYKEGDPMSLNGSTTGIFPRKGELPAPLNGMGKHRLIALAQSLIDDGNLTKEKNPNTKKGQASFLAPNTEGFEATKEAA